MLTRHSLPVSQVPGAAGSTANCSPGRAACRSGLPASKQALLLSSSWHMPRPLSPGCKRMCRPCRCAHSCTQRSNGNTILQLVVPRPACLHFPIQASPGGLQHINIWSNMHEHHPIPGCQLVDFQSASNWSWNSSDTLSVSSLHTDKANLDASQLVIHFTHSSHQQDTACQDSMHAL